MPRHGIRWLVVVALVALVLVGRPWLREAGLVVGVAAAIVFGWMVLERFRSPAIRDWADAERAAAAWLRGLGCRRVRLTTAGADGGVDVTTSELAVQVKHTTRRVGRPTLQQIVGAALALDRAPAVFSTAGFSAPAIAYGADHDVALFHLHTNGKAEPLNRAARRIGKRSLGRALRR